MSLQALKEKNIEGLKEELIDLRQTQLKLTMQKASGQLEQTHQLRQVRRDIARVKTVLAQQNVKV